MKLIEITRKDLELGDDRSTPQSAFRLYSPVEDGQKVAVIWDQIAALESHKDQTKALAGIQQLKKRCDLGRPLHDVCDSETYHEAFSFHSSVSNRSEKVHRWRQGAIRLYLYSFGHRQVLLCDVSPKRKDQLSQGEKSTLALFVDTFLRDQQTDQIEFIATKQNDNT